jgi:hypothetical protein
LKSSLVEGGRVRQLAINTFGATLGRESDRFLVKAGVRRLSISAHKVQGILITTKVSLSTDALQLAAHNVDVGMLDQSGEPYGRSWQDRVGSSAASAAGSWGRRRVPRGGPRGRLGRAQAAEPVVVERDPDRSTIICALLEKRAKERRVRRIRG